VCPAPAPFLMNQSTHTLAFAFGMLWAPCTAIFRKLAAISIAKLSRRCLCSIWTDDRRPTSNVQCPTSNVQRPTSDIRRPETTITTDNNRCRSPEIFHKMSLRSRRPRVPNPQSTCAQPKRHTDSDLSLFAYISWT